MPRSRHLRNCREAIDPSIQLDQLTHAIHQLVHGHNQPDKPETVPQTEAPEDCSLEVLMHEEQDGAFDRWEVTIAIQV